MHSKMRSNQLIEYAALCSHVLCSALLCFTLPRAFNARVRNITKQAVFRVRCRGIVAVLVILVLVLVLVLLLVLALTTSTTV